MQRIAQFEKVSLQQFTRDWEDSFSGNYNVNEIYNNIKLPKRATTGSAGYDFYSPVDFTLNPNETIKIPTGIRSKIENGWVLMIYPRSGLGFKFRLQLNNTVGVIDSDYYNSDNEGHIMIKITNCSNEGKTVTVKAGEAFAQGVFTPFGITYDDCADGETDMPAIRCCRRTGPSRNRCTISPCCISGWLGLHQIFRRISSESSEISYLVLYCS